MLAMTMPIAQIMLSPLMKLENPRLGAPYGVGLDDMGSPQRNKLRPRKINGF